MTSFRKMIVHLFSRRNRVKTFCVFVFVILATLLTIGRLFRYLNQRHRLSELREKSETIPEEHSEKLIALVRSEYLFAPSSQPYNLEKPKISDPSRGQSVSVLDVLSMQKNGFFVECGALDGETRSNTLFMERFLGWQGLLIEADPENFKKLRQKNRHAWSINACLNDKPVHSKVLFKPDFNVGRLADIVWKDENAGQKKTVEVDCFPLHTVLLALNRTTVDYFSLDVEGAELDVIKSIPFDLIDIRTLSVEYFHTTGGGKEELRRYLEQKGYTVVDEVNQPDNTANDFILVKNSAFPEIVKAIEEGTYFSDSSTVST